MDLIVVVDASTLVSAALKADSLPERVLLRAVNEPNRLLLSQEVEDEYRKFSFARSSIGMSPSSIATDSGSDRCCGGSDRGSRRR